MADLVEAFAASLHENPGDALTWLAMADWFEESGQPRRAELLRLWMTLRKSRRMRNRAAQEERMRTLLREGERLGVPELNVSLGVRLALVPPGRFRMGAVRREPHFTEDEKAHE